MNEIDSILSRLRSGDISVAYECGPVLNNFISSVLDKECNQE